MWEGIKKIINIKPTNKSKTTNLNINGNLTTDKIKIAKEFYTFFNTILAKIDSKIVPTNYSFLDTPFFISMRENPLQPGICLVF